MTYQARLTRVRLTGGNTIPQAQKPSQANVTLPSLPDQPTIDDYYRLQALCEERGRTILHLERRISQKNNYIDKLLAR